MPEALTDKCRKKAHPFFPSSIADPTMRICERSRLEPTLKRNAFSASSRPHGPGSHCCRRSYRRDRRLRPDGRLEPAQLVPQLGLKIEIARVIPRSIGIGDVGCHQALARAQHVHVTLDPIRQAVQHALSQSKRDATLKSMDSLAQRPAGDAKFLARGRDLARFLIQFWCALRRELRMPAPPG